MISIHRVSQIRARTMPEQRWVELTFNQGYEETTQMTVYFNSVELAKQFFETMPVADPNAPSDPLGAANDANWKETLATWKAPE